MKYLITVGLVCGLLSLNSAAEFDFSGVPGTVISHQPAPNFLKYILRDVQYAASPSITILTNGHYIVSHDIFGHGSTQDEHGMTRIFRSVDRGNSWEEQCLLTNQFWSTVFNHDGALYIIGPTRRGGKMVLRKSEDEGGTWTEPVDEMSGLLRGGGHGGTPNRPVIFDQRLWYSVDRLAISAPVGADFLYADSWKWGRKVRTDKNWLDGRFEFMSEAQVVAAPDDGVHLLFKVNKLPYCGVVSVGPKPECQLVPMPGGEKKFGAAYDPVWQRYIVLSNPVLPVHVDDKTWGGKPQLIRNATALLSSPDLLHWDVEYLFLYSPNIDYEAFQYPNFEFEGRDLAVVCRTAFDVGGPKPPRGHDSNLITFHRISDFRDRKPDFFLQVDQRGEGVTLYERTQHESAPWGEFPLGVIPPTPIMGVSQAEDGSVYLRGTDSGFYRYDSHGNFLDRTNAAPIMKRRVDLVQTPRAERTWLGAESGVWEEPTNWRHLSPADTAEETAIFGSAATAPVSVNVSGDVQLKELRLINDQPYTFVGEGRLTVGERITVQRGAHFMNVPLALSGDTVCFIAPESSLHLAAPVLRNGYELSVIGGGQLLEGGE